MKILLPTCMMLAAILSQAGAQAQSAPAGNCPAMMGAADMRKDMGAMAGEMERMTMGMHDPEMRSRMQKMHAQIAAMMDHIMMDHMQKMEGRPRVPAPAAPEEHKGHQPGN